MGAISAPLAVHCRVNAGPVASESWVHDPTEGGGRILGEVCHFVDLIQYLTGGLTTSAFAVPLASSQERFGESVAATLRLDNGSVGTVSYVAGGDKAFPRERVELFGGGIAAVIDNFRSAIFSRGGKRRVLRRFNVDRGHEAELTAFFEAVRTGAALPVSFESSVVTTLATFAIEESLRAGIPVAVTVPAIQC